MREKRKFNFNEIVDITNRILDGENIKVIAKEYNVLSQSIKTNMNWELYRRNPQLYRYIVKDLNVPNKKTIYLTDLDKPLKEFFKR